MNVKEISFSETRPMRSPDGEKQTATFVCTEDPLVKGVMTMRFGGHTLAVHNSIPHNFDTKAYWLVYTTTWNNFAAYGDEANTNKAYELACYVDYPLPVEKGDIERFPLIIKDFVSALAAKVSNESSLQRVSHIILRKAGGPSIYEVCFQKALKTSKSHVWDGLIF